MGDRARKPDELDDDDLVSLARGGDDGAFAALVVRHQEWATAYAARVVGAARAPDAVQEALERICKSIERYRSEGNFRGYFATVLRHCCVDLLRKEKEALAPSDGTPGAGAPGDGSAGDVFFRALADRDLVTRAIASLDDRQRRLIELRYLDELACQDIAERLGRPLGSIKRELSEAHAALYAFIMKQEIV